MPTTKTARQRKQKQPPKPKVVFTTKPLTLEQRIDANNLKNEINPVTGYVITKNLFAGRIRYLRYGLETLNGVEITEENFDTEVNKLTNDEITFISDYIAEETNFSKKK